MQRCVRLRGLPTMELDPKCVPYSMSDGQDAGGQWVSYEPRLLAEFLVGGAGPQMRSGFSGSVPARRRVRCWLGAAYRNFVGQIACQSPGGNGLLRITGLCTGNIHSQRS